MRGKDEHDWIDMEPYETNTDDQVWGGPVGGSSYESFDFREKTHF